jgi:hypothetical protein
MFDDEDLAMEKNLKYLLSYWLIKIKKENKNFFDDDI